MNVPEDEINRHLKSTEEDDDDESIYHRVEDIDLPRRYPIHNDKSKWYLPHYRRYKIACK